MAGTVVWQWQSSGSNWSDYTPEQSAAIEQAHSTGKPNVNLGPYWIDFMQMKQHSSADPMKTRKVQRTFVPTAPALVVSGLKGGEESAQAPPPGSAGGSSHPGRSHGKH